MNKSSSCHYSCVSCKCLPDVMLVCMLFTNDLLTSSKKMPATWSPLSCDSYSATKKVCSFLHVTLHYMFILTQSVESVLWECCYCPIRGVCVRCMCVGQGSYVCLPWRDCRELWVVLWQSCAWCWLWHWHSQHVCCSCRSKTCHWHWPVRHHLSSHGHC